MVVVEERIERAKQERLELPPLRDKKEGTDSFRDLRIVRELITVSCLAAGGSHADGDDHY